MRRGLVGDRQRDWEERRKRKLWTGCKINKLVIIIMIIINKMTVTIKLRTRVKACLGEEQAAYPQQTAVRTKVEVQDSSRDLRPTQRSTTMGFRMQQSHLSHGLQQQQ